MKEIAKNLKKVFEEGRDIVENILEDEISAIAAGIGMSQADFAMKFPGACAKLRAASAGIAAVRTGIAIQNTVKDFTDEQFKNLLRELSNDDEVEPELILTIVAVAARNAARLSNDIFGE